MIYRSHSAPDLSGSPTGSISPSTPPQRIAIRLVSSSRPRSHRQPVRPRSLLPVIGADDVILPSFDETLGAFAIRAQQDDREARDALYFAFLPKLTRLMSAARPPFAGTGLEGIWNRDDVEQEAYLVFLELVDAWSGDVSFTAFVLSRFPWRLKDSIRRGIGKPSVPPRHAVVSLEEAGQVVAEAWASPETEALIDTLVKGLPEPLGAVLIAHVLDGKTKTEIARALGISRRTMVRYWQDIRAYASIALVKGTHEDPAYRQAVADSSQCAAYMGDGDVVDR
jgi:RNA polymerase sigma factor (sigma-70 family)